MADFDGSATTDQIRAAEKREAAAKVAAANADAAREQIENEPAERSEPPKGRRSAPKSQA